MGIYPYFRSSTGNPRKDRNICDSVLRGNYQSVPASAVTGDIGSSPIDGAAIHLSQTEVTGTIYAVDATGPAGSVVSPTLLTPAMGDLTTAYNDAAGRTVNPIGLAGNIGGQTLYPGLYKSTGSLGDNVGRSHTRCQRRCDFRLDFPDRILL